MKNIYLFVFLIAFFITPHISPAPNMESNETKGFLQRKKTIDFFMLERAAMQNSLADSLATIVTQPSDWKRISKDNAFTMLIYACEKDSSGTALRYLIEKGVDLRYRSKSYAAGPLHYAAQAGYLNIVKLLVEQGLDVNENTFGHSSPLSHAAQGGSLEVVKYLVKQGAITDTEQGSPVFNAAGYGHYDVFKYMVKQLRKELDWQECLQRAILGGNPEIVKYLVEKKKVDINVPIYGTYPIQTAVASYQPHVEIIDYLLLVGASLENVNNGELFPWAFRHCGEDALLYLLQHIENPSIQCSGGGDTWCGLAEALDNSKFKLAEWMLNVETDYTFREKPLLVYFADGMANSSLILEFLIQHNINTEYLSEALLHAAAHDDMKSIETLLNAGADINFEQNGENALCLANRQYIATLLIEKGIDTQNKNFIENLWQKPDVLMAIIWNNVDIKFSQEMLDKGLNYAARACHGGAISYYISKGANPNYLHPNLIPRRLLFEENKTIGMTALMVYVTFKPSSRDMIRDLVKAGAKVTLTNEEGMTALHYAAMPNLDNSFKATEAFGTRQNRENGGHIHNIMPPWISIKKTHENILHALLHAGADINATDNEGKTPLQRAIETNNTFAIDILKRAGGK